MAYTHSTNLVIPTGQTHYRELVANTFGVPAGAAFGAPVRFALPADVLAGSWGSRNDVWFSDTSGNLLGWRFTNAADGLGYVYWDGMEPDRNDQSIVMSWGSADATDRQSSGADVFGSGIVAWYPLDEGAGTATYDYGGNSYTGTIINPYAGVWGTSDYGPVIVGNDSAYINAIPQASVPTGTISLICVVRVVDSGDNEGYLSYPGSNARGMTFAYNTAGSGTVTGLKHNTIPSLGAYADVGPQASFPGTWRAAAAVWDASDLSLRVYVDGLYEASDLTFKGTPGVPGGNLLVATWHNAGGNPYGFLEGQMLSAAVFNITIDQRWLLLYRRSELGKLYHIGPTGAL